MGELKWYQKLWATIIAPLKFVAGLFTESDGNGGKPSISRVLGTYVTYKIVMLIEVAQVSDRLLSVPPQLMTLFWVLIGYQMISKLLGSMSPAVLDIARTLLLKAGATVNIPTPDKTP
jgi:hypothetical protein